MMRGEKSTRTKKISRENERWLLQNRGEVEKIKVAESMQAVFGQVVLREYFLKSGGIEDFIIAAEDLASLGLWDEEPFAGLMGQVVKQIPKISDTELKHFSYKKGVNNLRSASEARILTDLIVAGRGSEVTGNKHWEMPVAAALLMEFGKRPQQLFDATEKTPLLALMHDLLYAAASTDNDQVIEDVGEIVYEWTRGKKREDFVSEVEKITYLSLMDVEACINLLRDRKDFIEQLSEEGEHPFEEFNPALARHPYWVGTYDDRLASLGTAFDILSREFGRKDPFVAMKPRLAENMMKEVISGDMHLDQLESKQNQILAWRGILGNFFPNTVTLDVLLSSKYLSKRDYVERKSKLMKGVDGSVFGDKNYHLEMLDMLENDRVMPKRIRKKWTTEAQLTWLFLDQPELSLEELHNLAGENEKRLDAIKGNFNGVAGGGDWYRADRDAELRNMGIDVLGIRPVYFPERKSVYGEAEASLREAYAVELHMAGAASPDTRLVTLTVADDGRIFFDDAEELRVPIWIREPLMKVVLDRIAFSTRRVATEEGSSSHSQKQFDELVKPSETYRWRPLPNPPFHLRSREAQKHAEAVLNDPRYGYDIYAINLLWRSQGIIGEQEVVTYVRPSEEAANRPREMVFRQEELTYDN